MKKIITIFLVICSLIFIPNVKALDIARKEKVKIYLFWGSYCPHCHDFIKYMIDNYDEYKEYGEVITFQVDGYKENLKLMNEVSKNYDDVSGGIPLIIIGSDFHQEGFGKDGSGIIAAIKDAYNSDSYKDIVRITIKDSNVEGTSKSLEDASKVIGYTSNEFNSYSSNNEVKEDNFKEENKKESFAEILGNNYINFEITPTFVVVSIIGAIVLAGSIVLIVKNKQKSKEKK